MAYVIAGIAAGLTALPLYYKEHFLFHPTTTIVDVPDVPYCVVQIPYSPVRPLIENSKYKEEGSEHYLSAWLLRPASQRGVILICNGNGGNKSYHLSIAKNLLATYEGFSILMFDYEGFGGSYSSDGPSFEGLQKSTRTALLFLIQFKLRNQPKHSRLIVFGNSIGSGAATHIIPYLTSSDTIIYQNGFPSLQRVIESHLPFPLSSLYGSYLSSTFNNREKIQQNRIKKGEHNTPYLCALHSLQDEVIPFQIGKELGQMCNLFIPIQGTHNEVRFSEELKKQLQRIMESQYRSR